MSEVGEAAVEYRLLRSDASGRRVREALVDLFAGDGDIYLVVGFFTYNGYRTIRPHIIDFLERSRDNRLTIVVGPSSDQFSPQIARDLWNLDEHDQVEVYKYRRGLHAKLYLRDGPEPHVIMGSANLTKVGFEYNLELGIELIGGNPEHPSIEPFREWLDDLIAASSPMRTRDLLFPMPVLSSIVNWTNKGRLLPADYVVKRVTPVLILLLVVWFAGWLL